MDPVQAVQEFIDAFNARDVDRVVGCCCGRDCLPTNRQE